MATSTATNSQDIERLREENYNALVVDIRYCNDDLMIVRVRPDRGVPHFAAGQYTVLGMGNWEPRVAGVQPELGEDQYPPKLIKRAYSISSPISDGDGGLIHAPEWDFLEFYIALIRRACPCGKHA